MLHVQDIVAVLVLHGLMVKLLIITVLALMNAKAGLAPRVHNTLNWREEA
jgi:hypothetical protein